jgi:hypothetical protein
LFLKDRRLSGPELSHLLGEVFKLAKAQGTRVVECLDGNFQPDRCLELPRGDEAETVRRELPGYRAKLAKAPGSAPLPRTAETGGWFGARPAREPMSELVSYESR